MIERIIYKSDGTRRYLIGDREVTEMEYKAETWQRDERTLKDLLESGIPPRGVSDCTFMHSSENGKQFAGQEQVGNHYRKVAEKAGVSITGKKYLSGLARYPGDPRAWVDSRGDVQRVLEQTGQSCEGTITMKGRERSEPYKSKVDGVADDILNREVEAVCAEAPNGHLVDRVDLKEQVRENRRKK